MEDFYDLNEYFAVGIRKWKNVIILIVIFALILGGARTYTINEASKLVNAMKGGVWGVITGFLFSTSYVYAVYVSGRYIYKGEDLNRLGIPLYGIYRKKHLIKLYDKILERVEGNISVFYHVNELAHLVSLQISSKNITAPILFTGCIHIEEGEQFIKLLNEELQKDDLKDSCWLDYPDIMSKDKEQYSGIFLIEKFNRSSIYKIKKKLEFFSENDIKVLGIIGIE